MATELHDFSHILLNLMVIYDNKFGIAKKDKFPFPRFITDFEFMCRITKQVTNQSKRNVLIYGRKTWSSDYLLIKQIWNTEYTIVLSQTTTAIAGVDYVAKSITEALIHLQTPSLCSEIENIWVMGGSYIYELALESNFRIKLFATHISSDFDCDVYFPHKYLSVLKEIDDDRLPTRTVVKENGCEYTFHVYERV